MSLPAVPARQTGDVSAPVRAGSWGAGGTTVAMRKQFGSTLVIGNGNGTGGGDGLRVLRRLEELVELVEHGDELFVRWSEGPDADASERSCDAASGLDLPGLAVNPLRPPGWW